MRFVYALNRAVNFFKEAGRRIFAFALSVLCGVVVPLCTLPAEFFVRGEIDGVSWFSAGVTYVAGIGLVSSWKSALILMLVAAGVLAFLYGVDMQHIYDYIQSNPGKAPPRLDARFAKILIAIASALYVFERVGRHIVDNKPFPE